LKCYHQVSQVGQSPAGDYYSIWLSCSRIRVHAAGLRSWFLACSFLSTQIRHLPTSRPDPRMGIRTANRIWKSRGPFSSPRLLAKDPSSSSSRRPCRTSRTSRAAEQLFKTAWKVNDLIFTAGIVLVLVLVLVLNLGWACKYCVAASASTGADYSHVNISL
jgi:hypothetical protein